MNEEMVFGEVFAYLRVIDFQERGLPHGHRIFILSDDCKVALMQPSFISTVTLADITPSQHQALCDVVLKCNLHEPCGDLNPTSFYERGILF